MGRIGPVLKIKCEYSKKYCEYWDSDKAKMGAVFSFFIILIAGINDWEIKKFYLQDVTSPIRPRAGFPLSLGDLGDLGDQKYFYQWNSEKRKWNFNGFPIFPWNQVHFIQSNSDNGNNKTNAFPILRTTFWMHFRLLWTGSLCFLRLPICLSL